jgi:hypothetical protein
MQLLHPSGLAVAKEIAVYKTNSFQALQIARNDTFARNPTISKTVITSTNTPLELKKTKTECWGLRQSFTSPSGYLCAQDGRENARP